MLELTHLLFVSNESVYGTFVACEWKSHLPAPFPALNPRRLPSHGLRFGITSIT